MLNTASFRAQVRMPNSVLGAPRNARTSVRGTPVERQVILLHFIYCWLVESQLFHLFWEKQSDLPVQQELLKFDLHRGVCKLVWSSVGPAVG